MGDGVVRHIEREGGQTLLAHNMVYWGTRGCLICKRRCTAEYTGYHAERDGVTRGCGRVA